MNPLLLFQYIIAITGGFLCSLAMFIGLGILVGKWIKSTKPSSPPKNGDLH